MGMQKVRVELLRPGLQGLGATEGLRGRKMIIVQRQEMPFLFVASQE